MTLGQGLRWGAAVALTTAHTLWATDVLTGQYDFARTGQNLSEQLLTPANVGPTTFGKLFTINVDGQVYAQPLFVSALNIPSVGVRDVVFIATEHNSVYACDAGTGTVYWKVSMSLAGETPADIQGCNDLKPELGITGTPVIDRSRGANGLIYVVAMTKDSSGNYHHRLHALDLATGGEEEPKGPVEISASYPGTGDNSSNGLVIFDPKQYNERPALALSNGIIYTAWASHCDHRPYTGWIMGYDEDTLRQVRLLNLTPNGVEGGIWQGGSGIAVDGDGFIFAITGNGSFDTAVDTNGFPNHQDFGNCLVKLDPSNGSISVNDYWTMWNTVTESNGDVDFGSGGCILLPDMKDSNGAVHQLAVGSGKDDHVYLFDRTNLGKFNAVGNSTVYQDVNFVLGGGVFGAPAYFNGALYVGANGDTMRRFTFTNARLDAPAASRTAETFPFPGVTPTISANGSTNGIVWGLQNGAVAVLHAYDATDLTHELYNSQQAGSRDLFGAGVKFAVPMVANGRVYAGTSSGVVAAFGLLGNGTPTTMIAAAPALVSEGGTATFTISLAGPNLSYSPLTINYAMSGSAMLGTRYSLSGTAGQVSIPPGGTSATVTLDAYFSKPQKGTETATMTLTPAAGYVIGSASAATVTIKNTRANPPSAGAAASPTSIAKGGATATYTILLSGGSVTPFPLTINYTMGGTAQLGTHYTLSGTPGQVTIPAGGSSATVTLTTLSTGLTTGSETAIMTINPGPGYAVATNKKKKAVTVTIRNGP